MRFVERCDSAFRAVGTWQYQTLSLIIFLCGLSATLVDFWAIVDQHRQVVEKAFLHSAQDYATAITEGMARHERQVRAVAAFLHAARPVSREEFSVFAAAIISNNSGIQALEWIPRVFDKDRAAFEDAARKDSAGFHFTERQQQGEMISASLRPTYYPVYYVEPLQSNETALGFDLGSDSARLDAMNAARDGGAIVSSEPLTLVQERGTQQGVLFFQALYQSDVPVSTIEERRHALLGFALGVIRVGDMVETVLNRYPQLGIDLAVYSDSSESDGHLLYTHSSRTRPEGSFWNPRDASQPHLEFTAALPFGNRIGTLHFYAAPGQYDLSPPFAAWAVMIGGLVATVIILIYAQRLGYQSVRVTVAMRAVRESEKALIRSQEIARLGNWTWEIEADKVYASTEFYAVMGKSPGVFDHCWSGFLACVHPDDREMAAYYFNEAARQRVSFSFDHRILHPDGSVAIIHQQGEVENSAKGLRLFGVGQDVTSQRAAEERIAFLALHDALTGLPNRTLLKDRVSVAISNAHRRKGGLGLMILDIDNFKTINDALGHSYGDQVLEAIAGRLSRLTRNQDSFGRLGGDEFMAVLADIKDGSGLGAVAERLMQTISDPILLNDRCFSITCSIGISLYPDHGEDAETLIKNADAALQAAKASGRNDWHLFSAPLGMVAAERQDLESGLRMALECDQFFTVYQPQMTLSGGRIDGAEALLRWQHPDLGVVPPSHFIPIAEDCGLIVSIGQWVLNSVCRQIRAWKDEGYEVPSIAVNASALQLRRKEFVDTVGAILDTYHLETSALELELTETALIDSTPTVLENLNKLDAMGVRLLIDDFGTGYSSLGQIKRFPVHKLKVDQSFVRDIGHDQECDAIVSTIISMAKTLHLRSVAEGVETETQLTFLREQGCDEVQGYLIGRPVLPEEFGRHLQRFGVSSL